MKLVNGIFGLTAAAALAVTSMAPAQATQNEHETTGDEATVTLRVTDLETGEVVYEEANSQGVEDGSISATISAEEVESNLSPLDIEGGTKTGTITSTLNIQYSPRPGEEVRLERVYGNWSSPAGIELSNREVGYNSGELVGSLTGRHYPTVNSFDYTTGWGYRTHYPATDTSGPRAYSSIDYRMSGGSTQLRQELFVNLPDPQ